MARRPFSLIWPNLWCHNIVFSIDNLLFEERTCLGGSDCEAIDHPIDLLAIEIEELLHSIVCTSRWNKVPT